VASVDQSVTVTITISDTANRLQVTLSGVNPNVATAPASVTIPGGQKSVSFTVTGNAPGSTNIIAKAANHTSDTAVINVR
jgi:hypothetical protein